MIGDESFEPAIVKIGETLIGEKQPVFIIAEIGINHDGSFDKCVDLIEAAAASGADAVKLQTINAEDSYVTGTISHAEFKGKEFSVSQLAKLVDLSRQLNVLLFSTPGDFLDLDMMVDAGMCAVKVSSGLMTNLPLIAEIGKKNLPVIISTGMAYEDEIKTAVSTSLENGSPGVVLLKCTALYPAPEHLINLRAIATMRKQFDLAVGYSDHTLGSLACLSAVALGATVIEKHFTLDKTLKGADHGISMEPAEFSQMVSSIRRIESLLGYEEIHPTKEEISVRGERHRCLVARQDIAEGELFTRENLALKRPSPGSAGLSPEHFKSVINRRAAMSIPINTPITKKEVQ